MNFFKTKYRVIRHEINEWYYPQYRYWWPPFYCYYTVNFGAIYFYSYKHAEQYIIAMKPKKVNL